MTENKFNNLSVLQKFNLLSRAIEEAQNGFVITDIDGNIVFCNDYIAKLSGYTKEELIGKHTRTFKSGVKSIEFYKNLWDTIKSGKTWKGKITNKKKNGEFWHEILTISPVFNDKSEIEFFIAIQVDTSEMEKKEAELEEKKENLLSLIKSIKLS